MKCSYCDSQATYKFVAIGENIKSLLSCDNHIQIASLEQQMFLNLEEHKSRLNFSNRKFRVSVYTKNA